MLILFGRGFFNFVFFTDMSIFFFLLFLFLLLFSLLQKLYVSRLFDVMEIEGLSLAISSVLDILFNMLAKFSKVHLD